LLLAPGACQVYYGDESCRNLIIPGASGDATLRGPMNWDEIRQNASRNGFVIGEVMAHYRKLGQFRREHPAVGAGIHARITHEPYVFSRTYENGDYSDHVVVGLDLEKGEKTISVGKTYEDGASLHDYYSGSSTTVKKGRVVIDSDWEIVLLGRK